MPGELDRVPPAGLGPLFWALVSLGTIPYLATGAGRNQSGIASRHTRQDPFEVRPRIHTGRRELPAQARERDPPPFRELPSCLFPSVLFGAGGRALENAREEPARAVVRREEPM